MLMSASMDKSLIVWKYDDEAALWVDQVIDNLFRISIAPFMDRIVIKKKFID